MTCTAADAAGNRATSNFTVVVTYVPPANHAPICTAARPSVASIWPVNHQWVAVNVLGVTDPDNDAVRITITGIFQDEAVNEEGDGDTRIDGKGVGKVDYINPHATATPVGDAKEIALGDPKHDMTVASLAHGAPTMLPLRDPLTMKPVTGDAK